jgi:multidrug efflux pump subunit AcrA (membrane-fusion protein)
MSMNAFASGAVQKIDNVTAYSISTLELLGANILLADKATWQKTRVLAAQASATTADLTHSPDLEMDLEKLSEQITSLTASLNNVATNQQQDREQFQLLSKQVQQQGELLTAQAQFIQEIAAERKQAAVEAQSKEQQEQQQQTQQQIAELVSNAVSTQFDSFQKAVLDRINPSRSPVGLTTRPPGLTPVVASGAQDSGNSTDIKLSPMQYELLQAQSQLAGMERSRHTGSDRVKLIEQCRMLKAQGVVLPSGMSPHQSLLTALV